MSRSLFARQTSEAGKSWRKWQPVRLQPWYEYRAGFVGFLLVYASLGAWLAVLVMR